VGTTRSGVVGFEAAVLTFASAFFLNFPAARLGVAVELAQVYEAWPSPWCLSIEAAQESPPLGALRCVNSHRLSHQGTAAH